MAKPVVSFPKKGVARRADQPYRTERFVSSLRVYERVATLLDQAAIQRDRRIVHRPLSKTGLDTLKRLVRQLDGPDPLLRLLAVVEWYRAHCLDKYVPWIEGPRSLYEKFGRLEARMHEASDRDAPSETVDEVVARVFNGSTVLADSFRSGVLGRARGIDFGAAAPVVAARLGEMYRAVRGARQGPPPPGVIGPMALVEQYVSWLGEQDWLMTTRVLTLDSPAFNQFRREVARRHPRGLDPVTGRE